MFTSEYSAYTTADPAQIWKLWSDVPNWSSWDKDVESCVLNGPFQEGTRALLKPRGGPKINIEIVQCVALKSFETHSFLPLTTISIQHEITPSEQGHQVTHRVDFKGWLAPVFYCLMGRSLVAGIPAAVNSLIEMAEKKE